MKNCLHKIIYNIINEAFDFSSVTDEENNNSAITDIIKQSPDYINDIIEHSFIPYIETKYKQIFSDSNLGLLLSVYKKPYIIKNIITLTYKGLYNYMINNQDMFDYGFLVYLKVDSNYDVEKVVYNKQSIKQQFITQNIKHIIDSQPNMDANAYQVWLSAITYSTKTLHSFLTITLPKEVFNSFGIEVHNNINIRQFSFFSTVKSLYPDVKKEDIENIEE